MNAKATKFIKSWLGLTRSTSVAVLHHPVILDIPFFSDYNTKAKLSYLSSVCLSPDPFIEELSSIAHSSSFMTENGIPLESKSIHTKAIYSPLNLQIGRLFQGPLNPFTETNVRRCGLPSSTQLQFRVSTVRPAHWKRRTASGAESWMAYQQVNYHSSFVLPPTPFQLL